MELLQERAGFSVARIQGISASTGILLATGLFRPCRFWRQCAVGGTPKALLSGLPLYPQKLVNVGVAKGFRWQDCAEIVAAAKAAEISLEGQGASCCDLRGPNRFCA